MRDRLLWALVILLSLGLLIAPALWNGFPLLQWDTGGYLARTYEATLVPSRAVIYGLILRAGVPFAFWPVLLVQSALTVWILALMLRAHGFGGRPLLLLGLIFALSLCTTLPWLTAILLTDIFCGLGVLALYLLLMRADGLSRAERGALVILAAVGAATHNATLAVMLALVVAALVLHLVDRGRMPRARLASGGGALVLGALIVFAANYAVAGRLAWTPGGFSIAFGRMLQDGIVKKYLDAHCPDPRLRLCAVKDRIPQDADTWFWGSDLFDSMGRFAGLGKEMETVAIESIAEYPMLQLKTAAIATLRQLVHVRTGEGVLDDLWHTRIIIGEFTPELAPAMKAAHQQAEGIDFMPINVLHYPLALLAIAGLPLIAWGALRRKLPAELGELAAVCMIALLANAFVCGALSNPHDRYGARMIWLASLAGALALVRVSEHRRVEVRGASTARAALN
ncbi:MAG: hypothetical protein ACK4UO_16785 [Pseudolabrys sp.]